MNFYFVRSLARCAVQSPAKQKNVRETWWHLLHISVRENLRETYYQVFFHSVSFSFGMAPSKVQVVCLCSLFRGQCGIFLRNRCVPAVASSEHLQYHTLKHVCFVMVSTGSLFLPNEICLFKRVFIFFSSLILFIRSNEYEMYWNMKFISGHEWNLISLLFTSECRENFL